jgi:hypothetical protein
MAQPHISPELAVQIGTLRPEQAAEVAALALGQLEAGRQPYSLFVQLARLVTLPTVEVIPLRQNEESGEIETLLAKRPPTDQWWPNAVHVPGTVVLPGDPALHNFDLSGTYNRLLEKELGGSVNLVGEPRVLELRRVNGDRGAELSPILWATVEETGLAIPDNAHFYPVNNLPRETMPLHMGEVWRAAEAFASVRAAWAALA